MVNTTDATLLPEPMPQQSFSAIDDGYSEVGIKPKLTDTEQDLGLSQPPLADRHKELERKVKILNGKNGTEDEIYHPDWLLFKISPGPLINSCSNRKMT